MSNGNLDVGNALLAKFYAVLTAGGVAPGAFLSYVDGGYPYSSDDLTFLTEGVAAHPDQAASFAAQVNAIPSAIGTWAATSRSLATAYFDWLQVVQVPQVTLTSDQSSQLTAAQTQTQALYTNYKTYRQAWQQASDAVYALMHTTPRPADYMQQLRTKQEALQNALQDWEQLGQKSAYERSDAIVQQLTSAGYDGIVADLRNRYQSVSSLNQTSAGSNFVPVLAQPADFYTDNVTWNTFTFSAQERDHYIHNDHASWGGGLAGAEDLFFWSVSTGGSRTDHYEQIDSSSLSVSFDYIRVSLDRSAWFDTFLLQSQAWWYPGATRAHPQVGGLTLSNGEAPPKTSGEWQMIPEEVIFTRNLSINMDTQNSTNQSTLTTLYAKADVKFLIFPIAQASASYNDSTSKYHFQRTASGIYAPQMQMMGFLCNLMPAEPNPDPALLAS